MTKLLRRKADFEKLLRNEKLAQLADLTIHVKLKPGRRGAFGTRGGGGGARG